MVLDESNRLDRIGEYDQAIELLSAAIATNPEESIYWLHRGTILCDRLQRAKEAVNDFQTATTLAPHSAVPHQHLSLCYLMLKDLDSASRHAEHAVDLANDDALSHGCLARARLHSQRFHSAVKHFELALELDSKSAIYSRGLGEACRGANSLEKAEKAFQYAVDLEPTPGCYIQLASIQLESGKRPEAVRSLECAQEFDLTVVQRTLVDGYLGVARP